MARTRNLRAGLSGLCLALLASSCVGGPDEEPGAPTPEESNPAAGPFEPVLPATAVAKVKNLILGQAPTEAEVQAVAADPAALRGLIDQWMEQPAFAAKMLSFFRNAFQQGQVDRTALQDQLGFNLQGNGAALNRLLRNIEDSFPRTAWQLVREGRPFHEVITSERFMLTPPLATLLAYLDMAHRNDAGRTVNRILQQNPRFSFTLQKSQGPIPIEQTLDPKSPNYMKWYNPIPVPAMAPAPCKEDPRVFTGTTTHLLAFLYGAVQNYQMCRQNMGGAPQFADEEFETWRMVTIRRPAMGEETTAFYDLRAMRGAKELVLRVPHVGFFSTPAFFANWATNSSNQARVTMNQTLIVALGKSFDDTNSIVPVSEPALDKEHAEPGTPCYGCHRTLDPMRQFFRQAYTLYYHEQQDPVQTSLNGVFAFDGVTREGRNIRDLARMLAEHPRFARAWTQKLCWFANSAPCVEDDPEFLRVVEAFRQSGHQFNTLVRELLSSPLVTALRDTKTFQELGVTVAIARRDHLCVALSNRLGIADACGAGAAPTRRSGPGPWPSSFPPTATAAGPRHPRSPTIPTCSSARPRRGCAAPWPTAWWTWA